MTPDEEVLIDELYAAVAKAQKIGMSLGATWGHVHTLGLHLEYRLLQEIKSGESKPETSSQSPAGEGSKESK